MGCAAGSWLLTFPTNLDVGFEFPKESSVEHRPHPFGTSNTTPRRRAIVLEEKAEVLRLERPLENARQQVSFLRPVIDLRSPEQPAHFIFTQ